MATTAETKVRVCVIGCGVSGAAAAGELVTAGVEDVLVVEAVGRPGGRVHTLKHGDGFIEIGAHWIHGEEGNCIFEWAKENCPEAINTVLDITQTGKGDSIFVDSHGTPVPGPVIDAFEDVVAAINNADMSESGSSLGEFYQQRFSGVNLWGTTGWQLLEWHGRYQSMIDGSDSWHSVSAATRSEYWECPGNLVINWNTAGYQTVIDHLMSRVGPERVLLNSPVTRIEWAGDCSQHSPEAASAGPSTTHGSACSNAVSCITATEGSSAAQQPQCVRCGCRASCRVTLPDRVVVADHVIFSGSLGVLKDTAHHLFQPPLPPRKLLTIESLGFDTVAKVYLQFESSWWPENCSGFSFLQDLTGTPPDPVEKWEQHLLGFYTVWQQPRMLCGWLSGPPARAMELTPLPDVITRCHAVLKDRLRHVCQVPRPGWGTRSSWGSNPYTRGAYSFRSCRSDERDVWADDLATPVTVAGCPVVCFCGEATHRHYYSTVHGAWESGVREAKRLLQHWRGEELIEKSEETEASLLETEQ